MNDDVARCSVRFEVTMEDLDALNEDFIVLSPFARRAMRRYVWTPPIGWAIIAVILAIWRPSSSTIASFVFFALISIIWVLVARRVWRRVLKKRMRAIYREGINRTVFGDHKVAISASGISHASETSDSRTAWAAVERITETPRHIFLYVGAGLAHIVPRRAFSSEADAQRFVAAARRFREAAAGIEPLAEGYLQ
jgi:hypothetical protein